MALTRREMGPTAWPADMMRRLLGGDWMDGGWVRTEQYREGNDLVVRAELPGIDPKEDVEVTVVDDTLHIHAERKEKHHATEAGGFRTEFRYGSLERAVPLPPGTDADKIAANYSDGILTVRVTMPEEKPESSRVIPVQES